MSLNNILIKSEENYQTGMWAESQDYYDVALSRLYYTLYQKIIYIVNTYEGKSPEEINKLKTKESKKGIHELTITLFIKIIKSKLNYKELAIISNLQRFRLDRNRADYRYKRIETVEHYNKTFKEDFEKVLKIINRLIEEENHNE